MVQWVENSSGVEREGQRSTTKQICVVAAVKIDYAKDKILVSPPPPAPRPLLLLILHLNRTSGHKRLAKRYI